MKIFEIEDGIISVRADQFDISVNDIDDKIVIVLTEKAPKLGLIEQLRKPKKVVDKS